MTYAIKPALEALAKHLDEQLDALAGLDERAAEARAAELFDEVCDAIYEACRGYLPHDRIGIALLENDGQILRAWWARTEYEGVDIYRGYSASMDASSSLQQILDTGEARILNDLRLYLQEHPQSRPTQRMIYEGIRSSLTGPLVTEGRPLGFIFFSSRRPDTYDASHVVLLAKITAQLSHVLGRSSLAHLSR